MSRKATELNDVDIIRGNDHAVGTFVQVTHARYAGTVHDKQGEGYVMDYDQMFGFSVNLIGATEADLEDDDRLAELAELYVNMLGL